MFRKICLLSAALLAQTGCSHEAEAPVALLVTSSSENPTPVFAAKRAMSVVAVGYSVSLHLFRGATDTMTTPLAWVSRDPAVATVDGTGAVVGIQTGSTWVAVHSGIVDAKGRLLSDSAYVTVVTGSAFDVNPHSVVLVAGDSVVLSAASVGAITWKSLDTNVATVSATGVVHSRIVGNMDIVARNDIGVTTLVPVAVTAPPIPTPVDTVVPKPPVDTVVVSRPPVPADTSVTAPTLPPATPPVDTVVAPPIPPVLPTVSRVTLPTVYLDTMVTSARTGSHGRTITAATFGALQAAVDTSKLGDIIVLTAGSTYSGNLKLRKKSSGAGWITIRSSSTNLPSAGSRMRPTFSTQLPKLVSPVSTDAVITTDIGAHHYLLQGIEVTANANATTGYSLIALGTNGNAQSTTAQQPSHLVLDRVYVHGTPVFNFQRCVQVNTGAIAIVDSWISECHGKGFDSQAIFGYNGSGPFKIENNYLEGAGENVMFGGADPSSVAMLPADIEIRNNHFFKPLSWKGGVWSVKNLLELKLGLRAIIEDNLFENCWVDGQGGFAVLFKTVNQGRTAAFSETRDITFRRNIVRNAVGGVGLAALPENSGGVPMSRIAILDNWFDNMGNESLFTTSSVAWLFIEGNTGIGGRGALRFNGGSAPDSIVLRSNIFGLTTRAGDEVISGDAVATGVPTMNMYARTWAVAQNVFIGAPSRIFPTGGNFYPLTIGSVGFLAWPNPLLPTSSPYAAIGAPVAKLIAMEKLVVVPP